MRQERVLRGSTVIFVLMIAGTGTLYFEYRQGSSGRGDQIDNVHDPDTRTWQRLLDVPLLDGRGLMNAYGGPRFGLDGMWHAVWVWRNTPCNSTNHTLS